MSSISLNVSRTQGLETAPSKQFLSDYDRMIFVLVNRIVLCTIIGLFGMASNFVNICVFIQQGLGSSINKSFFAMALSDLFRITTNHWMNVCSSPFIDTIDAPFVFVDIQYLTGGWPTACANRITLFITAYITVERCLCIALPLTIKKIITPGRTIFILIAIDVLNVLGLVPEYASAYFDWKYFPSKNRTLLALAFRSSRPQMQGIAFTVHAILLVIALLTVTLFTSVLVLQLRHYSNWRHSAMRTINQKSGLTKRDQKTVKMVITIATVMVVCYAPAVVLSLVSAIVPDFSVAGSQVNLFHAMWSFGFLLGIVNASINIFIYYYMSSSYREAFNQIFQLVYRTKKKNPQ
ncbi:growth hormone secretagogue receptor type 1 [Biomphalaria glabrata]|nr:growth hormone secretagogue receptor type 1-like [Biomphalaria glabrata]